jgi:hypothetical protein
MYLIHNKRNYKLKKFLIDPSQSYNQKNSYPLPHAFKGLEKLYGASFIISTMILYIYIYIYI